jgi:hypothetical protein
VSRTRLVVVLGYSRGAADELHEISVQRVRRGEATAGADDAVLLSGGRRRWRRSSEAELMARSWRGPARRLELDLGARSTFGNAAGAVARAQALGASEIVLVTSGWHGRRAASLFRAAFRGTGSELTLVLTEERGALGARLRELACWSLVPFQRPLIRRGRARTARAAGARVGVR